MRRTHPRYKAIIGKSVGAGVEIDGIKVRVPHQLSAAAAERSDTPSKSQTRISVPAKIARRVALADGNMGNPDAHHLEVQRTKHMDLCIDDLSIFSISGEHSRWPERKTIPAWIMLLRIIVEFRLRVRDKLQRDIAAIFKLGQRERSAQSRVRISR